MVLTLRLCDILCHTLKKMGDIILYEIEHPNQTPTTYKISYGSIYSLLQARQLIELKVFSHDYVYIHF